MGDFVLESPNDAVLLMGLSGLSVVDAVAIIQNVAKKSVTFPTAGSQNSNSNRGGGSRGESFGDGDGDNSGGFNAENLSLSKMAYFEEYFNVTWTPTWDRSCSDATIQLLKLIEEKEDKEVSTKGTSRSSAKSNQSSSSSNNSNNSNNSALSEDLKKVTAGMVVYLKCSIDDAGFKDASNWDLINDVALCCATLLKVCSMKQLSYSYGFVNNNIIALIITVSQSVCTKLSANKEPVMLRGSYSSLLVDNDIHEAQVNDQETSYSAASQVEMMDGHDDSSAKGGANAYSSRLRTRNTKVVYTESADSKGASSKRTFWSSPAANLVLAFINSNSLLDYVTSRNIEHITDIYLEMMFSAMFCMDHKSEEFCLDKENLALRHSTCESLLFVCVFSGEQSAMRFMRLVISILTFSVRDCSIFPKEEKLKVSFQKLVNEKIMTKFIERLAVDDTNASGSKRRTKASSSNSRKTNSNSSRAASSGDDSARLNILQDPIDRNAISVMMLGLMQRLLLSFNGEQKTSTRSIIQNCLSGLIDSIGMNLLLSQAGRAYSAEDRLIWSRMVSRFLKFVFKASKSTSHHLRYAATDLASLILHSCDWIWFSTSLDDLSTLEDMSSDWLVDTSSNQNNLVATSLPKLLLITLLFRMNDSNASVRLKALNSIADLFQTIVAYAENENGNYDTLFSNESKSIEMSQLGKDDVLFLIKSQYLLRLCLGTNIVLLNPIDPLNETSSSSCSTSRSIQAVSLMEILRTRCDDLKSLIVAKSLFCYFHALSINWIRIPTLRPLFLRWTYLNGRRQGLTTDMIVAEEGGNSNTNDHEHDDAMDDSKNGSFYFDAVPLYIGEDDVTLISNYCSYSNSFNSNNTPTSISIRKQSIVSLTSVLKNRIENNLLAGAWVTSVMVAIADLENTVIDKAVVCIHDILIYSASNCRAIFERLLVENLSPEDLALAIKHIKQFQMVINVCDFIMSSDKNVLLQKCVSVIMQSGRVSDIPGYSLASASNFGNHGSGGNVPNVDYCQLVDSVRFMCSFDQFKNKLLAATGSIANGSSEVVRLLDGFQESIVNSGWLLMESIMLGQFSGINKHNYNIVSMGGQQESKLAPGRGKRGGASSRTSDSSEASGGSGTTEGGGNNELSFTLTSLLSSKSPQLIQVREFIECASHLKIINCIQTSNSQQLLANLSEIFSIAFKEIILRARLMSDMTLTNNEVKMLRILETLLLNSVNYQKMLSSNNAASTSFFDDLLFISVYVECLLIKGSTLSYTALSSALSLRFAISKIFASVTSEVFENGSSSSSSKEAENRALRSYLSLLQWDLTRWARPLLSMSHFVLYSHAFRTMRPAYACPFSSASSTSSSGSSQGGICNVSEGEMESIAKSLMHQHSIVELCNRSLFLLGEISILGFVSEEVESKVISLSLDSSGTSSISNCSVNNDSNRIYIKVIIPEALVSIVQLYLGTTLPRSNTSTSSSSASASADGGAIVKTSDIVGADFDVTKIVANSSHLHDDRSNIASRCFAFISLGKLCIRSQALARSSLNLYLRELSLNSSDQTSRQRSENNGHNASDALAIQSRDNNRSNTLLVLGDLCVRHTNLVERHINQISLCLQPYFYDIDGSSSFGDDDAAPAKIFNSILVRKHAFIVITQLLQQDYVKCSGELLLRLAATAANDPDVEMVEFSKLILKRTLLLRNPDALLSHVSEAVVFFNSCTSFSAFNYQMGGVAMDDSSQPLPTSQLPATQSNDLDLLSQQNNDKSVFKFHSNGGANLNGPANRSNRLKCYALMLEDLTDEQKITVTVKIVNDILSSAIDILQSPKHLSNSSNSNSSSNASVEYLSNFNSVIEDTFLILQSPLLKVGRKSQAQAQEELDIDGGDIGASQVPASQAGGNAESSKLNNLKLKTLKALNKQVMINHVVPVVFSMKHILQKCKSPLQGWLMGYLMFLTKSHKVEMDQILATDPIMKAEIEYELRHFDNDNDTQQQQTVALGVGSATAIRETASISNRGDEQVNRRTSIERARHIARVVSTAEKIHYSAKKDNTQAAAAVAAIASGGGRRSSGGGSSHSVSCSDTLSKSAGTGLALISSTMKLKSGRLSASSGGDDKKAPSVRFTSISPSQDDAFPRHDGEPLGSRKGRNEKGLPEAAAAAVVDLDTLADRFTSSDKGFRRQATTHKRATSSVASKLAEDVSAVALSTVSEEGPVGNEENVPRNKKVSKKK